MKMTLEQIQTALVGKKVKLFFRTYFDRALMQAQYTISEVTYNKRFVRPYLLMGKEGLKFHFNKEKIEELAERGFCSLGRKEGSWLIKICYDD